MLCPRCKKTLDKVIFHNVDVDYCPYCLGAFFEEKELDWAKNEKDKDLRWLDIDLWENKEKFKISYGIRLCPNCRVPLYEVYYGDSGIIVDVCNLCKGIWLERGEFKKIIEYMKATANYKIMANYLENLRREFWEIFAGPETLREEIVDFLTVVKLLNYKFSAKNPEISELITTLRRITRN